MRWGFVNPEPRKRPRTSWRRFEAHLPNETWQAGMAHWALADGTEVETLDFVDDYCRMVVGAVALSVTTVADVVAPFYQAASTWGFPTSMLTDIQVEGARDPPIVRPATAGSGVTGSRSA